jgi:hypothetical protein
MAGKNPTSGIMSRLASTSLHPKYCTNEFRLLSKPSRQTCTGSVQFLALLFLASRIFRSVIEALDAAYRVEKRQKP